MKNILIITMLILITSCGKNDVESMSDKSKVKEMQDKYADKGRISLSLHCEHAELLRVFLEEAREKGIEGLQGYHEGRPALTEELAITEAAVLAKATGCPVNFLHLSSKEAFETAD